MSGWIKLYRELLDKPIWTCSKAEQKVVLIALLAMANHEGNEWEWKGQRFRCEAGQFITSLNRIAEKAGVGVESVRSSLRKFEKYEFLTNESTKTGRLITIVNWGFYQGNEDNPTNQPTKSQQRANKEPTTNKNDKNNKNIYENVPNEIYKEFMDFAEMRKDIKHPIKSLRTVTGLLNSLRELSTDIEEQKYIIRYCTNKCWQSFYRPNEPMPKQQPIKEKYTL